jgi:hypothetical protein
VTVGGYIAGAARCVVILASAVVAGRSIRKLSVPEWSGAIGVLADATGSLTVLIAVAEVLGTVSLFDSATYPIALVIVAALTYFLLHRRGTRDQSKNGNETRRSERSRFSARDVTIVAASAALVLAQWSTWVANAISSGVGNAGGPGNGDSLWYHMPTAAAFVQSASTIHLPFLNGEALVTYYPADVPLLHAIGMLGLGSDFLSAFINFLLLPIALLAGWCIGDSYEAGAPALAGVAIALTIPVVVASEAGSAKDDVLGLVGLLAAIAFLIHSQRSGSHTTRHARRRFEDASAAYCGAAGGLALGSKLTFVVPVVALGIALAAVTARGARGRTMFWWIVGTFATGGYWYLRNLLSVGNPLPGLHLGIGAVSLPRPSTPSVDSLSTSLVHEVTNWRLWHTALIPGLRVGFGTAWPLIFLIVTVALVGGSFVLHGRARVVAIVGLGSLAAFLITPGTVFGANYITNPLTRPVTQNLFAFNLRYMLPAVAIGLVIVPVVALRWKSGPFVVAAVLGLALAATQISAQGRQSWIPHHIALAVAVAVVVAGSIVYSTRGRTRTLTHGAVGIWPVIGGCVAVLVLVGLLYPVFRSYQTHRYAGLQIAHWADAGPSKRIGYSGLVFAYPVYGAKLQNTVQMLGEHGPDGSWHPVSTCAAWRRQIRSRRLQYVMVPIGAPTPGAGIDLARWRLGLPGGEPPDEPPESIWSRSDPHEQLEFVSNLGQAVFKVTGGTTLAGCPSAPSTRGGASRQS